jgi:protein tyrosine/serine phosphatase
VVHCVSGKDRTGLVVALLLALIPVSDAAIAEDYALSAVQLRQADLDAPSGTPRGRLEGRQQGEEPLSPPEAVHAALRSIRERHGSVEDYLEGAGLTLADMDLLRSRLVAV